VPWSLTPTRRDEPELMDAPGLPEAKIVEAYRVLRRVNRQLGNLWVIRREVGRFLAEDRPSKEASRPVTAVDIGSGSGDIPEALARLLDAATAGSGAAVIALDRDATAVRLARHAALVAVQGDALRLPFGDRSVDLVTAVKLAHHFSGTALVKLVGEMARVARHRVIILDIRRHWLAYYGFIAWSRVFTRNHLVRYDGPLSVLRGFTAAELAEVGAQVKGFEWTTRSYPGFQLALVGHRTDARR
jgi:2-polyprenyl-3-methyl-5-hydroxy-6-metoxy-1,4-benzoquinol methylase